MSIQQQKMPKPLSSHIYYKLHERSTMCLVGSLFSGPRLIQNKPMAISESGLTILEYMYKSGKGNKLTYKEARELQGVI